MHHTKHRERKEEQRTVWGLESKNCGKISSISRGYKSIPLDLHVPLSIVKFTTHCTLIANLHGYGWKRKFDKRLQQRMVWMVDKQPQSTSSSGWNGVSSNCPSTSERNETLWQESQEETTTDTETSKSRLECLTMPKSFWENILWTDGRAFC